MFWGKFWRLMFLLLAAALLLVTGLGAWLASDRMERIAQIYDEATIYETSAGPQQAIVHGDGSPLLVLHGVVRGGCDMGMLLARRFGVDETMEVIAPSRPGYLGTPLDGRISAEAQAEALAALLDTLERDKVAIFANDAATDVALVFAEKFPNRVSNLVIIYGTFSPQRASASAKSLYKRYRDDWPTNKWFEKLSQIARHLDTGFSEAFELSAFPVDLRLSGIIVDADRLAQMGDLPKPSVPTLIVFEHDLRERQGSDFGDYLNDHPQPPKVIVLLEDETDIFSSPDTAKAIREFLGGSAETPEQP